MPSDLRSSVNEISILAKAFGMTVVVIGGLVAEFSTEMDENSPDFPRTRDADFAFRVVDWAQFKKLKDALVNKLDFVPDTRIEPRLKKDDMLVDLIPYGPGIAPKGRLVWPGSKKDILSR